MEGLMKILGTGTSMGVPTLGCACAVCTSADPHDRRLRPSVLLRWNEPDDETVSLPPFPLPSAQRVAGLQSHRQVHSSAAALKASAAGHAGRPTCTPRTRTPASELPSKFLFPEMSAGLPS